MPVVSPDQPLAGDQRAFPLVWVEKATGMPPVDTSDATLELAFGEGGSRKIKSWGHRGDMDVHWLVTRAGTPLHTDPAYPRYTHHLILRNDGFKLAGLEDPEDAVPLKRGVYYCLDAHSPHVVLKDQRIAALRLDPPKYKVQVAFDDNRAWSPEEALPVLIERLYLSGLALGAAEAAKPKAAPRVKR